METSFSEGTSGTSFGSLTIYPLELIAERFDLTLRTLRNYLADGRLKARKFGGRWYVTEGQLREFFENGGTERQRTSARKV